MLAALLLALQAAAPPPQDSAALVEAAERAERWYEVRSFRNAPLAWDPGSWGRCDEIVGRFCLRYDDEDEPPLPDEPPVITRARDEAIAALRPVFATWPTDFRTAGALVRHLVDAGLAADAVLAAERFERADGGTDGALLLGLALHAAARDDEAEAAFARALERMEPAGRRRLEDVKVLLSGRERGFYEDLPEAERAAYEAGLWELADPLYLTPGNERRAEHFARSVWSRILRRAPHAPGKTRWGADLDELTLRYGVPASRERIPGGVGREDRYIERYHPDQLAFVPEALRRSGLPPAPEPGGEWPEGRARSTSGYAPVTVRKLVPLEHQSSRFPAADGRVVLRVDGELALDTAAAGAAAVRTGLFVLDSANARIAARLGETRGDGGIVARETRADTVRLGFELELPAGRYVYSLEALESESRLGGRARYPIELPAAGEAPAVSDLVVTAPFGAAELPASRADSTFRPLGSLVLPAGATVGLYAEASRLQPDATGATYYAVELSVEPADGPSLSGRAVRWLGERLGLAQDAGEPRTSWRAQGRGGEAEPLALDLALETLEPALYSIRLAVTDLVSGRRAQAARVVRVRESR